MDILERLFELQDSEYKSFQQSLMPTVDPDCVIGVRVPELRKFAKELKGEEAFLNKLPHNFFEENNLHAFIIEQITDFDECISRVNEFLPYVDNWATCDSMRPKCFKYNKGKLLEHIKKWLTSNEVYTVRYAIETLMLYYLDENFNIEYPEMISKISSEEYYINMMIAWYFATALGKQWDKIIPFIENNKLDLWIHNKTIQKAGESYRISKEQKEYLKKLKHQSR